MVRRRVQKIVSFPTRKELTKAAAKARHWDRKAKQDWSWSSFVRYAINRPPDDPPAERR